MVMCVQILIHAGLSRKKGTVVKVIKMLFESSVCSVETNRLVLFGEIISVCFGTCWKHVSADVLAIRRFILSCWHISFNNHCALES